ncbi:MAG: hypothetical protein PHY73_05445 [Candidatus Omnitrophica bacterium]|nr:hypothetical protein [Candidatus Omnitrophota bacterium]
MDKMLCLAFLIIVYVGIKRFFLEIRCDIKQIKEKLGISELNRYEMAYKENDTVSRGRWIKSMLAERYSEIEIASAYFDIWGRISWYFSGRKILKSLSKSQNKKKENSDE